MILKRTKNILTFYECIGMLEINNLSSRLRALFNISMNYEEEMW